VQKGNIYGTQFHPEKSGPQGLKILENFADICHGDKPA
jgi:glutamine amidotransferase